MRAHDLAKLLLEGPNLEVFHVYDGAARNSIEFVWVANRRKIPIIVTADYGETVYSDSDRPDEAPLEKEERYWSTPKDPSARY